MFGLEPDTLRNIKEAIARIPDITKVILYGSRAKGNYRKGSDIDITLLGKNLTLKNSVYPLMDELEELYLPYSFDISIFRHIDNDDLVKHIGRVGKGFYIRERVLPEGWLIKRIGDVCKTGAGGTPKKSNKEFYEGGTIPWLTSGEVSQGEIFESKTFITEKGLSNSSAKIFPRNTILVAMYGATAGQVGILRSQASTNQAVCGIYPNNDFIAEYIYYVMKLKKAELVAKATGNAQPNISQIKIKNTRIPYPPLPEQKRIVAILDEAFAGINTGIANAEKNLANARELFESYLNNVFTQKGEGWEEKKLGEICTIKHGFAFKSKFFVPKGDYIVLTPGSFFESGGFRDQGAKTKYYWGEIPDGFILDEGDFLIAMTEQAVGLLGSSLIVPKSNRFLHNQRLGLVTVNGGIPWNNDFFHHHLNTRCFRDAVQKTASGVKVRHTSPKKLAEVPICFPAEVSEQKRIACVLNEIRTQVSEIESIYQQKLKALTELKQSILQKAFSGELTTDTSQ